MFFLFESGIYYIEKEDDLEHLKELDGMEAVQMEEIYGLKAVFMLEVTDRCISM